MKYKSAVRLFASIIICELAGVVGSLFTTPQIKIWYQNLQKPAFNPPNWIFGPVWSTIFVLMGVSLYLVWNKNFTVKNHFKKENGAYNKLSQKLWTGSWQKINIIVVFCTQLFLNIAWSYIFFGLHLPAVAFFEVLMLWFAILFTIANFYRVSKAAAYLLLPYVAWVSFAAVLNYFIWYLNF